MAEGPDEHFVDGGDENFPKGIVSTIVLFEDGGDNAMGVAKIGDLGPRRDRWDGGIGARVDQSDEGRGRKCCVHSRGDSEL